MNFVADESVDQAIVIALRNKGHAVSYIAESTPSISDLMVLDSANKTNSLIITADKDFGELVFRQKHASHGIILIKLFGLSKKQKVETVLNIIGQHKDNLLGKFSVISPHSIRIRRFNFH